MEETDAGTLPARALRSVRTDATVAQGLSSPTPQTCHPASRGRADSELGSPEQTNPANGTALQSLQTPSINIPGWGTDGIKNPQ